MIHGWNTLLKNIPLHQYSGIQKDVNSTSNFDQNLWKSKPALFIWFIFFFSSSKRRPDEKNSICQPLQEHCYFFWVNPAQIFMLIRALNCSLFHRRLDCVWREQRMLSVCLPTQIRHFSLTHFLLLHLSPLCTPRSLHFAVMKQSFVLRASWLFAVHACDVCSLITLALNDCCSHFTSRVKTESPVEIGITDPPLVSSHPPICLEKHGILITRILQFASS